MENETTNQATDTQVTPEQPTKPETPVTKDKATESAVLTQDALKKRIAQAERAGRRKLLEELGADSEDTLRDKLAVKPNTDTSDKLTALEAKLLELERKNAETEQRNTALENQRKTDATKHALTETVKLMRMPETVAVDILNWAQGSGRDLSLLIDDALKPKAEAITELINAAREARPTWFKTATPGTPSNAGGLPSDADKQRRLQVAKNQEARLRNS